MDLRPLDRFRRTAFVEGLSYLALLLIAMPLKYLAGMPGAVKVVGWAHGVLFMLYIALLADVAFRYRWSFGRIAWALAASVIPGATFILEAQIRREIESKRSAVTAAS